MITALRTLSFSIILVLAACTQAGETTGMAAATGGVMGAGLGAIVGNQTGDTGAGLVIGAAAGSAAGAMVGNALEAQEQAIGLQDEAIERQEQIIAAQRREIEELRRQGQDQISYKSEPIRADKESPRASFSGKVEAGRLFEPERAPALAAARPAEQLQPLDRGSFGTKSAYSQSAASSERTAAVSNANLNSESLVETRNSTARYLQSEQCQKAEQEIDSASRAREYADKLYHYKRALRLCPDHAGYHNSLGEIYRSLNRIEDARYEFEEAVRLDPNHSGARDNLAALAAN